MGRRFAQAEIVAVLAVVFRCYSIELAVDDIATDEEVERMPRNGPQRRATWQKAADKAQFMLDHGMSTIITLQMRKGHVPLRIVRRGEERFAFV